MGGSVREQIACSGAIASTNCEIVARVFSDETHLMNGRNLRDPSMAAARVARLLIRHPHAPAVVRTATVARRMVWKQAAGCDAAQETKEEQRKILSQVSKRLQTMGGTFRWAVVQAAGHMRISTIMPVTSMPSTTHIGKLMAASIHLINWGILFVNKLPALEQSHPQIARL